MAGAWVGMLGCVDGFWRARGERLGPRENAVWDRVGSYVVGSERAYVLGTARVLGEDEEMCGIVWDRAWMGWDQCEDASVSVCTTEIGCPIQRNERRPIDHVEICERTAMTATMTKSVRLVKTAMKTRVSLA